MQKPELSVAKPMVLLVDDEREFRESTARALTRRGFEVHTAGSGKQALENMRRNLPQVVVLDLKMEGMDGLETLRKVRSEFGAVPVIILTGHGTAELALEGIQLSIVDFLQKPVDLDHLATHLRKFLTVRSSAPLHEKRVADLMVPLDAYRSLGEDRSVREALELLYGNSTNTLHGSVSEGMYRSIVIRRTDGSYRGVLRYTDLLDQLIPRMFWDGAHGPFYTGMFLAQCKVFGNVRVGDLEGLDEQIAVAAEAPLMQALVLMREARLCNMPVKRSGQVVGLLRDRDLFLLVCQNILL